VVSLPVSKLIGGIGAIATFLGSLGALVPAMQTITPPWLVGVGLLGLSYAFIDYFF